MKVWGWFVIAVLWLSLVAAAMLRGGLGVGLMTGRWVSQSVAMLISAADGVDLLGLADAAFDRCSATS